MQKTIVTTFLLIASGNAFAALPAALSDRIYKGSGSIDIMKDATGAELTDYLNAETGTMYLGVDLNEAADGVENSGSVGVAINDITLSIETTAGNYTFSDFQTNTTAGILSTSSATDDYYTLFGTAGSNQVTGGTSDFDLSQFDDVITIENIEFDGDVVSASLDVTFVDTQGAGTNEEFFDYSAGFEEFAIVSKNDAAALEKAAIGISEDTSTEVSFAVTVPSGTPEPWWFLVLALPFVQLMKRQGPGE